MQLKRKRAGLEGSESDDEGGKGGLNVRRYNSESMQDKIGKEFDVSIDVESDAEESIKEEAVMNKEKVVNKLTTPVLHHQENVSKVSDATHVEVTAEEKQTALREKLMALRKKNLEQRNKKDEEGVSKEPESATVNEASKVAIVKEVPPKIDGVASNKVVSSITAPTAMPHTAPIFPPLSSTNLKSSEPYKKAFYVKVDRHPEIQASRMQLPVCGMEQEIMEAIAMNDFVILCGN